MYRSRTGPEASADLADEDFSVFPDAWARFLDLPSDVLPDLTSIYGDSGGIMPDRRRVFRAFHLTEPSETRVVLLGQDPYPNSAMADGLAFSQPGAVNRRSALHRLFLSLERDPESSFRRPVNGDLAGWASSGVLLLNAALTMDLGARRAHRGQWARLITATLRALGDDARPIAFILLGRDAIDLALPELRHAPRAAIIRSAHPMAGAPGRERSFRDARVFSEANAFLADRAVAWADLGER